MSGFLVFFLLVVGPCVVLGMAGYGLFHLTSSEEIESMNRRRESNRRQRAALDAQLKRIKEQGWDPR